MPSGNTSNQAYQFIKEMITKYQWIPGQKITYAELAGKIGISKTPIINALHRLEQEEFVILIPNRGFFVKEISTEEVEDVFKIREALEILSVEEAIKNLNPKMLKTLENAMIVHREYDFSTLSRQRWALDIAFHLKIAEMANNNQLVKILKHVCELHYLRHRIEGISIERMRQTAREHQAIFDAIRISNIKEAKRLTRNHMRAGKIATINAIRKANEIFKLPD
jgi:DNA-binding GntR family transcriptional regulator